MDCRGHSLWKRWRICSTCESYLLSIREVVMLCFRTFCVGVSTAFGIITRLDRLMVAVKELVGEQYHIDGVGMGHRRTWTGEMTSPTMSVKATEV